MHHVAEVARPCSMPVVSVDLGRSRGLVHRRPVV